MRKLSNEVIDERLVGRKIKRLGDYIRNKAPIAWQCLEDQCGYIWDARPNDVVGKKKKKSGCPKCTGQLPITNEYVDAKLVEDNRNIQRLGDVLGNKTPLSFKCLIENCGYIWDARTDSILNRGQGCPKCADNARVTNEAIDLVLLKDNRNIKRIGNCVGNKIPLEWLCLIENCGYIWNASSQGVLVAGTGCPICNRMGISEKLVFEAFKLSGISFVPQFTIRNYDNNAPQYKIDFLIEEIELAIEYNGIQHYETTDIFGGKDRFIEQQFRDRYVRDFCMSHGIELIEIDGRKYHSYKLTRYLDSELIPYIKSKLSTVYDLLG